MIGRVENNLDPTQTGRLQIRIPEVHGLSSDDVTYTPTGMLPWSLPCTPWFASYDAGSFIVPPVGSYLVVAEVSANPSYYIYLGGVYGRGSSAPKVMNTMDPDNSDGVSMGQYYNPAGVNEVPLDLRSTEYAQSGVIFKSPKGHTIKYSDQDNAEFFEIIDRSGQSIKFECPVSAELNQGNQSRRGASSTQSGGTIRVKSGDSEISISNDSVRIKASSVTITTDKATTEF